MRKDMIKVLTERPRVNRGYGSGTSRQSPRDAARLGEDLPKRGPIDSIDGLCRSRSKEFTDVLGPLRNYLFAQVGRKWDDVYSEIRENMPPNSLQTIHLMGHVWQYVERHVQIIDGRPMRKACMCPGWQSEIDNGDLYVCPETGILKRGPKRPKKRKQKNTHVQWIDKNAGVAYVKYNGAWWKCRFGHVPRKEGSLPPMMSVHDKNIMKLALVGREWEAWIIDKTETGSLHKPIYRTIEEKVQLNSREIKKLGLNEQTHGHIDD